MKRWCGLFATVALALPACRPAEAQSLAKREVVHNLLGDRLEAAAAGSGIQITREADSAGIAAMLAPGHAAGIVRLGPVRVPPGTHVLRLTGALSLHGEAKCRLSATFSSGGVALKPVGIPYSEQAARVGGVFQDLLTRVPPGVNQATIELHLARAGEGEAALRTRYPCLTAHGSCSAEPPETQGAFFRHSFSHPDGRADVVSGAATRHPVWSCVLPTAEGKAGPGVKTEVPSEAMAFALPTRALSSGYLTFWLRPLWPPGDARPADMVKLSQRGRPKVLVRKNHGWSFLFVVWDRDSKTRGVSCNLRNLTTGQWTKVEAAWDAEQGLRLTVNGVPLGKSNCTWAVSPAEPVQVRIGQGEHDRPERAPYVLDEVEIRSQATKEVF